MTRIVIADDHAVVRKGLRLILAEDQQLDVTAEAASADELLTILRTQSVDAVILDVALGERDGIEVLKQIRASFPGVHVLMISMHSEDVFAIRAIRAGAAGYIEKSADPHLIVEAVRRVSAGGTWISPAMVERVTAHVAGSATAALPHERLSDREFEIFRLLGSGKTVTEIARSLNLSVKTVSSHRTNILSKTGFETNADIVDYVTSNSLR